MQWIHFVITMHSLALALIGSLLVAVLWKPDRKPVHWFFTAMLSTGFLWITFNGVSEWLTLRGIRADWVGSLGGLSILWLAVSAYLLSSTIPRDTLPKDRRLFAAAVVVITAALCPLAFSPDWISERENVGGVTTAAYGRWFLVISLWAAFVVGVGLFDLYRTYARESDSRKRGHLRLLLIGGAASYLFAFLLSFFLPLLGYDRLFFLGLDSVLLFFAVMTHSILFHRMFDLRRALLKICVRLILGVFLTLAVYALFLTLILDRNISEFSYELAGVLSLFFLCAMLFARVGLPAVDSLLFQKPPRAEDAILGLFRNVSMEAPLERMMEEILLALHKSLPFRKGLIIAADYQNRFYLHARGTEVSFRRTPARLYTRLLRLERLPPGFVDAFDHAHLLENVLPFTTLSAPGRRYRRILRIVNESLGGLADDGFRLVLPLMYGRTLCGLIILGEKDDDFPYFAGELKYLNALRLTIGVLLQHRRQWNRLNSLKDEARADRDRLTTMLGARVAGAGTDGGPGSEEGAKGRGRATVLRQVENRQLLYRSGAMERVMSQVEKFAAADQPVLVTGETGTGKELIARLIHRPGSEAASGRPAGSPFVAVNCAAISDQLWEDELFGHVKGAYTDAKGERAGRIQEAGEGVLFLDEIGEMPLEMQAKLLRLLQERKYAPVGSDRDLEARCRFVFATNRDLTDMIAKGTFREDLYYRINVFHLDLPPLRARSEDVPLLLEHFLSRSRDDLGFALREFEPAAMDALTRYAWPGNIRELENFVVRAAALSEDAVLKRSDLPLEMRGLSRRMPEVVITRNEIPSSEKNLRELVDDYTRRIIVETLKKTDGNRTRAAELLGVKRGSLLYRMKELDVE